MNNRSAVNTHYGKRMFWQNKHEARKALDEARAALMDKQYFLGEPRDVRRSLFYEICEETEPTRDESEQDSDAVDEDMSGAELLRRLELGGNHG